MQEWWGETKYERLKDFNFMFYPCSVFVLRSRNPSGSPRPRSVKKVHFIKNMRQYDTRGSRCVYSLLHVGVWVLGLLIPVITAHSVYVYVCMCVCVCRSVFSHASHVFPSLCFKTNNLALVIILFSVWQWSVTITLCSALVWFMWGYHISDSLYTNTEDTFPISITNLLKGPYFLNVIFFLFCAINEFDVLWKRRRTAEVDTII